MVEAVTKEWLDSDVLDLVDHNTWDPNSVFSLLVTAPGLKDQVIGIDELMLGIGEEFATKLAPAATIAGDIVYSDGDSWEVIAIGTAGQILTVVGGVPAWADFPTHASAHITGGSDLIPVFTSSESGVVPPAGAAAADARLRADGSWSTALQTHATAHVTGGADAIPAFTDSASGLVPPSAGFAASDWLTPSGWQSNFFPEVDAGSLLFFDGGNWAELLLGASGSVLQSLGGAPVFAALAVFSDSASGLVPAGSGADADDVLRADGTWGAGSATDMKLTIASHGLVAGDVGKQIGWAAGASGKPIAWDDTDDGSNAAAPVAVLLEIIDDDTIRVATSGQIFEIADSLLPASMPVNGGDTNSRFLYYDKSATPPYVHDVPSDAVDGYEALYWIGASPTAGNSYVIQLNPQRPPGIGGGSGGGGGGFEIKGTIAERNALPDPADGLRVFVQSNRRTYFRESSSASWIADAAPVICTEAQWLALTEPDQNQLVRIVDAASIYDGELRVYRGTAWSMIGAT